MICFDAWPWLQTSPAIRIRPSLTDHRKQFDRHLGPNLQFTRSQPFHPNNHFRFGSSGADRKHRTLALVPIVPPHSHGKSGRKFPRREAIQKGSLAVSKRKHRFKGNFVPSSTEKYFLVRIYLYEIHQSLLWRLA